jgi:hypothetical protein
MSQLAQTRETHGLSTARSRPLPGPESSIFAFAFAFAAGSVVDGKKSS